MKQLAAMLLMIVGCCMQLIADDFNPTNPAEPYLYNQLKMEGRPMEAVSSLSGAGYYKEGDVVTLKSSRKSSSYTFSHWEKNGEWFSDAASPKYTMENEVVTFMAVYEFTPSSPDEPKLNDNRLYLVAEPLTACTFNISSGNSYAYEQTVTLKATGNTGYTFIGWYNGGTKMSESLSFSFNMPDNDLTLTAKFEYNPSNPAEPEGGAQDNVQTTLTADFNGDNVVDIEDAVYVITLFINDRYEANADLNNDDLVDIEDAVAVISIWLKSSN